MQWGRRCRVWRGLNNKNLLPYCHCLVISTGTGPTKHIYWWATAATLSLQCRVDSPPPLIPTGAYRTPSPPPHSWYPQWAIAPPPPLVPTVGYRTTTSSGTHSGLPHRHKTMSRVLRHQCWHTLSLLSLVCIDQKWEPHIYILIVLGILAFQFLPLITVHPTSFFLFFLNTLQPVCVDQKWVPHISIYLSLYIYIHTHSAGKFSFPISAFKF